ncbi:unnamed protein product [Polarella glacialis]|uniref:Uncharacterized protein n=1 Tax=Polarella glacialis TaxID=89957 RepID=A0A813HGQ2_POLGL|nr:unnamed protein product [Polarella glacialis]
MFVGPEGTPRASQNGASTARASTAQRQVGFSDASLPATATSRPKSQQQPGTRQRVPKLILGPSTPLSPEATPVLPSFRACQQNLAPSWDVMQRRLSRKNGLVCPYAEDHPRLLTAAEDVDPADWMRVMQKWPEVARATARLRPQSRASNDMSICGEEQEPWDLDELIAMLEDPEFSSVNTDRIVEQLLASPVFPTPTPPPTSPSPVNSQRCNTPRVQLSPFEGVKTPPLRTAGRHSPRPASQQSMGEQLEAWGRVPAARFPAKDQAVDLLEKTARATARQIFDLNHDPFMAAEEYAFTLRRLSSDQCKQARSDTQSFITEANRRLSKQDSLAEKSEMASTSMSKFQETIGESTMSVQEDTLEKLEYLYTCRQLMGESRYEKERRRLMFQAQFKASLKYSVEEKPTVDRQVFSARVRGGTGDSLLEATRRAPISDGQEASSDASPSSPAQAARGLQRMLTRMPTVILTGPMVPPRAKSKPGAKETATFKYGRACAENKITMPILGSIFAATGDGTKPAGNGKDKQTAKRLSAAKAQAKPPSAKLQLGHWSLGDRPMLALASSPLREGVALLEDGDFRGNRLTGDGIGAIVANLSVRAVRLDFSDNCFDWRGPEVISDFLRTGQSSLLKELNLSKNRLTDDSVAGLCRVLAEHCPSLGCLGLSDVHLGYGFQSGPALGTLLDSASYMEALDVSFNLFQGSGAVALLESVAIARLRHLDLGFNCLGQPTSADGLASGSRIIAGLIANILRGNMFLQHLDLAHNRFSSQDAEILAQGLAQNHVLLGLHIEGNAAVLDPDGFLRPAAVAPKLELEPEPGERPPAQPQKKKKGTRGKKGGAISKEAADAENTLAAAEEHQARLQAVQNQLRLAETVQEWRGQMEIKQKMKRMLTGHGEHAVSLPKALGRIGVRVEGLAQESWLKVLEDEVRPDLRAMLESRENHKGWAQGFARSSHCRGDGGSSSCWRCASWVEVMVRLTPGVSFSPDVLPARGDARAVVCALFSINNFTQPLVLEPQADSSWQGSRFLPPTEEAFLVVFQIGNGFQVAQDLPQSPLFPCARLPLWQAGDEGEGPNQDSGSGQVRVSEVNLLRVGDLAEAFCSSAHPEGAAWVVGCASAEGPTGPSLRAPLPATWRRVGVTCESAADATLTFGGCDASDGL